MLPPMATSVRIKGQEADPDIDKYTGAHDFTLPPDIATNKPDNRPCSQWQWRGGVSFAHEPITVALG